MKIRLRVLEGKGKVRIKDLMRKIDTGGGKSPTSPSQRPIQGFVRGNGAIHPPTVGVRHVKVRKGKVRVKMDYGNSGVGGKDKSHGYHPDKLPERGKHELTQSEHEFLNANKTSDIVTAKNEQKLMNQKLNPYGIGERKYHIKGTGTPDGMRFRNKDYNISMKPHGREQAVLRNIDFDHIPKTVNPSKSQLVEVESYNDKDVSKYLLRMPYKGKVKGHPEYDNTPMDILMAFTPNDNTGEGYMKTAWLNKRSDQHGSVDISKYDTPKKRGKVVFT